MKSREYLNPELFWKFLGGQVMLQKHRRSQGAMRAQYKNWMKELNDVKYKKKIIFKGNCQHLLSLYYPYFPCSASNFLAGIGFEP